jgi:AraC-like DNA-binding protein
MVPLFRIYLWPDRLLLLGPGFDTAFHRHHAAQFCLGLERGVRLRQTRDAAWASAPGFFVPPDAPHQFDAGGGAVALLYLEPESLACAAALRRHAQAGPFAVDDALALAALRNLHAGRGEDLDTALRGFDGGAPPPAEHSRDPRVASALAWIAQHLEAPVRLAAVAAAVQLSASHLAHLFSAEVGVPLRRYVLWRRLRAALELAMSGDSLTHAAHAAGFADSAHLSRTFRANFGVAPSSLFEQRERIALRICA